MQELAGRTAVITGAASGIGFAVARALAREGMNVAIADLEAGPLAAAREAIAATGAETLAVALDVTDRAAVRDCAGRVADAFGGLHVLINNAGVGYAGKPLDEIPDGDYDWVIGVNLMGVINGIKAFVPLIKRTGGGGHVVNTASMAGLRVTPGWNHGLYSATKFAVVALSEGLRDELAEHGIGVSVLCPAAVATSIFDAGRNRPARYGGAFRRPTDHPLAEASKHGMAADRVADRVVAAIRNDEPYIITHPETRDTVARRHAAIMAAYDRAERCAEDAGGGA